MRKIVSCFFCFLGVSLCSALLAQTAKAPPTKVKAPAAKAPAAAAKNPPQSPTLGTEFEFEGTTVKGERTTPMSSILEQATADQSYDFVTIRQNWRREMLDSADSLDTQVSSLHLQNDE
jgi:hypothetical protein